MMAVVRRMHSLSKKSQQVAINKSGEGSPSNTVMAVVGSELEG